MTQNASIPKQVALQNLNPRIDPLGVDGTVIARDRTEWTQVAGQPRIAMLNNFGAAGSNGALLLQEPSQDGQRNPATELEPRPTHVFGFSAKSVSSLAAYKKVLIPFLKDNADSLDLCNVCYTSTARRQIYSYRSSVYASSMSELVEKLEKVDHTEVRKQEAPGVIFVFSGQGSQYISMGRDLFKTSAIFRKTVLDCESWLQDEGFPSCLRVINYEDEASEDFSTEEEFQAMQISIFVLEVGLARMWCEWGMRPVMLTGHSIGQYAALVIAETLDLIDALKIVAFRARLMIEKCPLGTTGMLAVNRSTSEMENYISTTSLYQDLSIACCNSPHDCVVGGPLELLQGLKVDLKENHKCKSTMLGNPMAYHTKAMEPILVDLTKIAASIKWSSPKIPVICNVLGQVVETNESSFTADFPAQHCRQSVKFEQGIEDALSNYLENGTKPTTWLEIGPHPSIISMVKSQASNKNHAFVPSMRKSVPPWETLCEAQSLLYRSQSSVNWSSIFSDSLQPKCTNLPSYQFDYTDFLVEYPHETGTATAIAESRSTGFEFLSQYIESPSSSDSEEMVFETSIGILAEYITGHLVCGFALCPASVYHEMALAAAELFEKRQNSESNATSSHTNMLSQISYLNPLIYVGDNPRTIKVTISLLDRNHKDTTSFKVSSYDPANSKQTTHHCQGHVKRQPLGAVESKLMMLHAQLRKPVAVFENTESTELFRTRAIYEKLFPRVVTYSKMYQAVQSMSISADGAEALATVVIPDSHATTGSSFAVNPVFMDVLLHVAGFVANLAAEDEDAFICKEVKSARVVMAPSDLQKPIKVYCSNTNVADGNSTIGNGYALSSTGKLLAVFKGMHFARVKLAKIAAGFRHISGATDRTQKTPEIKTSNGRSNGTQPSTNPAPGEADDAARPVDAPPVIDSKSIVAEVCGVEASSISSESELEALGIDSLMIHELGSRIQKAANTVFTNDELTACVTIKDVEALVASKGENAPEVGADQVTSVPPLSKPSSNGNHQTDSANSPSRSAIPIIVEICGVEASDINAKTELESLGIDSIMGFELEDKLKQRYSPDLDGEALASCKTVGDVDGLLAQGNEVKEEIAEEKTTPPPTNNRLKRPQLQAYSSSSSESNRATSISTPASTPRYSTPPTRETSTSPHPGVDPKLLQKCLPKRQTSEISPRHSRKPTRTPSESPHPSVDPTTWLKGVPKQLNLEDPLTLIQPSQKETISQPIVLIHDGSGVSLKYRNLHSLDRQLWGMSNPKAFSTDTWPDLNSMARAYAVKISATIAGPIILGGEPPPSQKAQ